MVGEHVSKRWAAWRNAVDLDEYDTRWDQLAAAGENVHGETDFIESFRPSSVLDAGCGMGRITIELRRRGIDAEGVDLDADLLDYARRHEPEIAWHHADLATMQLTRRFSMVAFPGNVMIFCRPSARRMIVHTAAQHLEPSGLLVSGFQLLRGRDALTLDEFDELCASCELELVERWSTWDREPFGGGDYAVSVHRRSDRFNVHDLVFEARSGLQRVDAHDLAAALAGPNPPFVADTRTPTDRERHGVIVGSHHIPRTVLEWHLDPANGFCHPAADRPDQQIVVVCNGGYSSSLAAANLQRLGFVNATDLIGGMAAWKAAGLAVEAPTHSHYDV